MLFKYSLREGVIIAKGVLDILFTEDHLGRECEAADAGEEIKVTDHKSGNFLTLEFAVFDYVFHTLILLLP